MDDTDQALVLLVLMCHVDTVIVEDSGLVPYVGATSDIIRKVVTFPVTVRD